MRDTGVALYDNISMALKIRHKYSSMIKTNTHTQNTRWAIMGVSSDEMAKQYLTLFGISDSYVSFIRDVIVFESVPQTELHEAQVALQYLKTACNLSRQLKPNSTQKT